MSQPDSNIAVGDEVGWKWGNSIATGLVDEVRTERTEILSKGKTIVRNGTPTNQAIIIRHKSGNLVLKLASEVQKISP